MFALRARLSADAGAARTMQALSRSFLIICVICG
jgi:hypothetical protein